MTENQIELARHALGLPNKLGISYRNHFCAGIGHSDYPNWMEMVEQGVAKRIDSHTNLYAGDFLFVLNRIGAEAALATGERLDEEDFPKLRESSI